MFEKNFITENVVDRYFKVYVKVFDVQTEQSRIEEYSGTLDVWINGYPPFL